MKHPYRLFFLLLSLVAACAATEQGPDDSQKTRLATQAARWAGYYNGQKWDSLAGLYSDPIEFNTQPMSASNATATMQEFRYKDYNFQVQFDPNSWVLDSMNGELYAGHLKGMARYYQEDSLPAKMNLKMRLPADGSPEIVAQYDGLGNIYAKLKRRHADRVMAGQDFDSTGRPNYEFWSTLMESLSPKLGRVHYCSKYDGKRLIYAEGKDGKIGIFDDQANVVIPANYQAIGQIGILLAGAMEVQQGEKYGLLGIDGKAILPVEYEAILPAFNKKTVALWGLKDGTWMAIDGSGMQVFPEGGTKDGGPEWVSYLKELPLEDKWNAKSPEFVGAPMSQFEGDDDQEYLLYEVLFQSPFTLSKRNILQNSHLYASGADLDEGGLQRIHEIAVSPEGNIRVLSEIETWGVGGRESFHNIESKWVVFEPEMKDTIQAVSLMSHELESHFGCDIGQMTRLGDTLMEVMTSGNLMSYWEMPTYHYFQMLPNGRLMPKYPERDFPFMSVRLIDGKFLEGCFAGSSEGDEAKPWVDTQDADTRKMVAEMAAEGFPYDMVERHAKHFRASDLDFMVNEVYAGHGYIFQKTKWKEYFATKPWYKAENAEVESQLTAIEKANIAFVRKIQSDMAGKETAYTQPTFQLAEYY